MEDKRIAAQKRAAEYNRKMIGQLYRHFKGDFYRVLFVAVHSETAELLVIYCKPEDTTKVWARPLAMFLSPVDTKKYPDAKQKMRFALVREVNRWYSINVIFAAARCSIRRSCRPSLWT